ncbi:hypothetical protein CPB84DRAFT_1678445 [Gymnopilus junonius]|uniref:Uncharacterized protein n=1 Tax=Gymnopilus junonius TaxID=109634 RepID=A0A9P5NT69_GYMJU|nr:hypothetical protein CPB84DRAFT_1678445 [Gymnopilus junonius]
MLFLNRRIFKLFFFIIFCFLLPLYFFHVSTRPPLALYDQLFATETELSKNLIHNERGNRYVKFRQLQGAGFNNQAQEILMYHHLALETNRIYVYQPMIWRPRGEKATIPLSGFLLGATKGTVSETVFDEICPSEEVVHVDLQVDHMDRWNNALEILNKKERCIVVDDWLLNWDYLSSPGIHTIWDSYRKYLKNHFKWSESIQAIFDRAAAKLRLSYRPDLSPGGERYMAIHLRRGDFEDHCKYLAQSKEGFTTWATLPLLRSSVLPLSLDPDNSTSVIEHCYPTLHRILDAISHQARDRPTLRTLHVLHDGAWDHPTVYLQYYKLAAALTNADWARREGWKSGPMLRVTHSAEVPIGWHERDWSVCVDVELGRRAEVFIGNGYSSLSTQIVALRLADGGKEEDITFL